VEIRLNRAYLDGNSDGIFRLNCRPSRFAYVPKDEGDAAIGERGLPEYILAYKLLVPTQKQEPSLFAVPHEMDVKSADEVWLKFPKATVIMITENEDDRFREENKELIERIESLYIGL
jgi:hypothetical protein